MLQAKGDLWSYWDQGYTVVVPTNCYISSSGRAVMSRGVAKQAADKFPGLEERYGKSLQKGHGLVHYPDIRLLMFPVKPEVTEDGEPGYMAEADLGMIRENVQRLRGRWQGGKVAMPAVGCDFGEFKIEDVIPTLEELPDDFILVLRDESMLEQYPDSSKPGARVDKGAIPVSRVVNMRYEKYDVYIGRGKGGEVPAEPGKYGWLGNPVKVHGYCPECGETHHSNAEVLPCYEKYLRRRLQEPKFHEEFLKLKGKRLGCFCKPAPCHGDVIVKVLEELLASGQAEEPKEDELPGKDELIAIGRAILNRDWHMVPEKLWGEWSTGYTTQGFMRAQKVCGKKLVTLLESNPRKVIDAKNKVMIYIEGDGEKRVGQVRRKGETYWLHWFDK